MRKILRVLLILAMIASLAACGETAGDEGYKIAMVTDYGDITDQSFNQTTWEAIVKFGKDHNVPTKYYKPTTNDTAGRVGMVELAIAEGNNIIVLPGFAFGETVYEVQDVYPDVKFIALDVSEFDVFDCFYNHDAAGNWTGLIDGNDPPHISPNVYCAVYREELSGYMAGYAAVKLGYTKLGFLGGMKVSAVQRFGHGYVQGADAAARELGIHVEMKYVYGGQFYGDADITAVMDTWYAAGTEVVFACGGDIYDSVAEAARKVGGKIIGVDTDQSAVIDGKYGDGITLTSAMKSLYPTTIDTLTDVIIHGNWADYAGKVATLGLVSGDDVSRNYVQIPTDTTQFVEGRFTEADYEDLVKAMFEGSVTVSSDTSAIPATTNTRVDDQGSIKG